MSDWGLQYIETLKIEKGSLGQIQTTITLDYYVWLHGP